MFVPRHDATSSSVLHFLLWRLLFLMLGIACSHTEVHLCKRTGALTRACLVQLLLLLLLLPPPPPPLPPLVCCRQCLSPRKTASAAREATSLSVAQAAAASGGARACGVSELLLCNE